MLNRKWVSAGEWKQSRIYSNRNSKWSDANAFEWACVSACVCVLVVDETRLRVSQSNVYHISPPVWVCACICNSVFFKLNIDILERRSKIFGALSMNWMVSRVSVGVSVYAFGINQPQTKLYAHTYWAERNINTFELCYSFLPIERRRARTENYWI